MKNIYQKKATKSLYLALFLLLVGLYLILAFALTNPFNQIETNAVLKQTVLPDILLTLIELVELVVYAVGASFVLFAAYRPYSVATTLSLGGLYVLCALLRYGFMLVNIWIIYGNQMFFHRMLEPNLIFYIPYLFLDVCYIALILIFAQLTARRYYRKRSIVSKASVLLNKAADEVPTVEAFYPFKKIFSKKNPLQVCALSIACFLTLLNIVSDILSIRYAGILEAVFGYSTDLLSGLIFYVLSIFVFSLLFRKQEKLTK